MHLWLFPIVRFLPKTHTRYAPRYSSSAGTALISHRGYPQEHPAYLHMPVLCVFHTELLEAGLGAGREGGGGGRSCEREAATYKLCACSWLCTFPFLFPFPQLSLSIPPSFCPSSLFVSKVQLFDFHSLNSLNHEEMGPVSSLPFKFIPFLFNFLLSHPFFKNSTTSYYSMPQLFTGAPLYICIRPRCATTYLMPLFFHPF